MSAFSGTGETGRFIVVGSGYGGLATAIELCRRGHEVEIIEAAKQLTTQGLPYFQIQS